MAGEILNNVQQTYTKGNALTTYTLNDGLSTWIWEGRTLSCLRDEDGNDINLGDVKIYTGNTARLSAIWKLNRIPLSVYLIGEDNGVSVKVSQSSNKWYDSMLSDRTSGTFSWQFSQRPEKYYSFNNTLTETSSVNVPYCGSLSIDISTDNDVNVYSVYFGGESKGKDTRHIEVGNWNTGSGWYTSEKSLSVTFTKKGILYYIPNQDYVNPR